jgi:pimeloyl-ACP methyl ester carboxylesterase
MPMSGCSPTRFRGLTRFAFGGDVIETKRVDRHTSGPSNVAEPQEGSVHVVEAFSRSGMRFTVLDEGPVDAETVVLLHGFPQSAQSWIGVSRPLLAAGYRVIAPD